MACEHFFDREYGQCIYCERFKADVERIAELEAELAGAKAHMACTEYKARAEKAETEAKRLAKQLDLALNVINPGREQRIRTFGGGLAPAAREERGDG